MINAYSIGSPCVIFGLLDPYLDPSNTCVIKGEGSEGVGGGLDLHDSFCDLWPTSDYLSVNRPVVLEMKKIKEPQQKLLEIEWFN